MQKHIKKDKNLFKVRGESLKIFNGIWIEIYLLYVIYREFAV